jgi:predicted TPR repeat methyltransferase
VAEKQHLMLRELLGKYPPEFETILAEDAPGGETKAVLDIGCGSGGW